MNEESLTPQNEGKRGIRNVEVVGSRERWLIYEHVSNSIKNKIESMYRALRTVPKALKLLNKY